MLSELVYVAGALLILKLILYYLLPLVYTFSIKDTCSCELWYMNFRNSLNGKLNILYYFPFSIYAFPFCIFRIPFPTNSHLIPNFLFIGLLISGKNRNEYQVPPSASCPPGPVALVPAVPLRVRCLPLEFSPLGPDSTMNLLNKLVPEALEALLHWPGEKRTEF